jgi:steroid 5-alpha reductase family enzyme
MSSKGVFCFFWTSLPSLFGAALTWIGPWIETGSVAVVVTAEGAILLIYLLLADVQWKCGKLSRSRRSVSEQVFQSSRFCVWYALSVF